ncbi:MAG: hypothetical protein J2P24_06995 [Streptosporangiales bacterium]|nr:hypothetical protein [Streptosporangiales bacterium]MBO0889283.1 hypothetical protein [Acidothermales bacterium]
MTPRGWSPREVVRRYRTYRTHKLARGETPRDRADWLGRVAYFEELQRRGNRFRDLAYDELGYRERDGWRKERYQPTRFGKRFQDIGNRRAFLAWEFKVGGGNREHRLLQLRKDAAMLRQGWDVVWVVKDGARMQHDVYDRAQAMARRNPRFRLVDLADKESVAEFAHQRPREAAAVRRAAERFDREEAVQASPAKAAEALLTRTVHAERSVARPRSTRLGRGRAAARGARAERPADRGRQRER